MPVYAIRAWRKKENLINLPEQEDYEQIRQND